MREILHTQNDQVSPTKKSEGMLLEIQLDVRDISTTYSIWTFLDLIWTNQLFEKVLNMWESLTLTQYLLINHFMFLKFIQKSRRQAIAKVISKKNMVGKLILPDNKIKAIVSEIMVLP